MKHRRPRVTVKFRGVEWDTLMEIYPDYARITQERGEFLDRIVLDGDSIELLASKYKEIKQ